MSTSEQQGNAPAAGWYVHPHTGQPAWWTGAGWTAAPPPPPQPPSQSPPQQTPPPSTYAPATVGSMSTLSAAPAGTGAVNQFGYPSSGPTSYATPGRSAGSTYPAGTGVRRSSGGGGSGLGTWLVVAVVAIVLVGGGLLVFRGLGKTAQAGADTAQTAISQAHGADVKQALINASQALETWYADHQNYAIQGPVVGVSATSHVEYAASPQGYCLRAYYRQGAGAGPVDGSYWWYDSQAGGLQAQPGPPSTRVQGGACSLVTTAFKPLS